MAFRIVFPIYPGVTHLDFTGPHQFLSRLPGAVMTIASMGAAPIEADGITFASLAPLEDVARCDLICVPGGAGTLACIEDEAFLHEIGRLAAGACYVTSVCSGSLILGAAGLLNGKRAACHWAWRDQLAAFGALPDPGRVVRDGHLITGGGVTAGIDFALTVIAEVAGAPTAQAIQLALEYAPQPPFAGGVPETAPPAALETCRRWFAPRAEPLRAAVRRAAQRLCIPDALQSGK
jgi:putative intracellular protease/amidase